LAKVVQKPTFIGGIFCLSGQGGLNKVINFNDIELCPIDASRQNWHIFVNIGAEVDACAAAAYLLPAFQGLRP
jgi:hypothetical protein